MKQIIAATLFLLASQTVFAEGPRTWEGTWNNQKYKTNGPLKCVATEGPNGVWTAKFTGTFRRDPFSYDAKFQSKTVRNQTALGGTSTIRGHKYQWNGSLKGNTLTGKYTSTVGYYGTFTLKEVGGN